MYSRYLKRSTDIIFALILIILFTPVFVIIALTLLLSNKGAGIFFTQDRPGKNEKIFKIIKFKTMSNEADNLGNLLPDEARLTKVGSIIRKASLDEIPQFYNVLIGDMSLIGPRPLMPEYLPLYDKIQSRRHQVRPGITGWAQCNGRNAISWAEKFALDVWYVDNISFYVDLRILFLTIKKVINKEGLYLGSGIESMRAFNGKN